MGEDKDGTEVRSIIGGEGEEGRGHNWRIIVANAVDLRSFEDEGK